MVGKVWLNLKTVKLAVAAIGTVSWQTFDIAAAQRRTYCQNRAEPFAIGEADILEQVAEKLTTAREREEEGGPGAQKVAALRAETGRLGRFAAWNAKMGRNCEWGVTRPWESIPDDDSPP